MLAFFKGIYSGAIHRCWPWRGGQQCWDVSSSLGNTDIAGCLELGCSSAVHVPRVPPTRGIPGHDPESRETQLGAPRPSGFGPARELLGNGGSGPYHPGSTFPGQCCPLSFTIVQIDIHYKKGGTKVYHLFLWPQFWTFVA